MKKDNDSSAHTSWNCKYHKFLYLSLLSQSAPVIATEITYFFRKNPKQFRKISQEILNLLLYTIL